MSAGFAVALSYQIGWVQDALAGRFERAAARREGREPEYRHAHPIKLGDRSAHMCGKIAQTQDEWAQGFVRIKEYMGLKDGDYGITTSKDGSDFTLSFRTQDLSGRYQDARNLFSDPAMVAQHDRLNSRLAARELGTPKP